MVRSSQLIMSRVRSIIRHVTFFRWTVSKRMISWLLLTIWTIWTIFVLADEPCYDCYDLSICSGSANHNNRNTARQQAGKSFKSFKWWEAVGWSCVSEWFTWRELHVVLILVYFGLVRVNSSYNGCAQYRSFERFERFSCLLTSHVTIVTICRYAPDQQIVTIVTRLVSKQENR